MLSTEIMGVRGWLPFLNLITFQSTVVTSQVQILLRCQTFAQLSEAERMRLGGSWNTKEWGASSQTHPGRQALM